MATRFASEAERTEWLAENRAKIDAALSRAQRGLEGARRCLAELDLRNRIADAYREVESTGRRPTPKLVCNALVIKKDWEASDVANADLLLEIVLSMGGMPNGN